MEVSQELLYQPNELEKFFKKEKPDYIFHLASYGNHSNQQDINMTVFANIIGTWNMLVASKDIDYKGFIQFGSSSEYGKKNLPMNEGDVLDPDTFYAASKAGATHLVQTFCKVTGKPTVVVRPFSVYGQGEADFRFIPTIIRSRLKNQAMDFIEGYHDWIYVSDFIEGVITVTDNIDKVLGKVVNIGSGKMASNSDIMTLLGSPRRNFISQITRNDSPVWVADISLIKSLGWEPKTSLEEGLKATEFYYVNKYS